MSVPDSLGRRIVSHTHNVRTSAGVSAAGAPSTEAGPLLPGDRSISGPNVGSRIRRIVTFRLLIATFQQLFERVGEPVGDVPQVRQQVGAGDDADTQFPVERHDGAVESRAAEDWAEGIHRVDL